MSSETAVIPYTGTNLLDIYGVTVAACGTIAIIFIIGYFVWKRKKCTNADHRSVEAPLTSAEGETKDMRQDTIVWEIMKQTLTNQEYQLKLQLENKRTEREENKLKLKDLEEKLQNPSTPKTDKDKDLKEKDKLLERQKTVKTTMDHLEKLRLDSEKLLFKLKTSNSAQH